MESIVNRVAREVVGEKMIVCGRAARWWDDEIKSLIETRERCIGRLLEGSLSYGMSMLGYVRRLRS